MTAQDAACIAARAQEAFERIAATRMRDFPLANPALRVQVVAPRLWEDRWVGVLVTPWAMNLLLLPAQGALPMPRPGEARAWRFPSGEYEFHGLVEDGLGACQLCSLFSPLPEFARHEDAVATAEAVMRALFAPPASDAAPATAAATQAGTRAGAGAGAPAGTTDDAAAAATLASAPGASPVAAEAGSPAPRRPLSRRAFLGGRVLG